MRSVVVVEGTVWVPVVIVVVDAVLVVKRIVRVVDVGAVVLEVVAVDIIVNVGAGVVIKVVVPAVVSIGIFAKLLVSLKLSTISPRSLRALHVYCKGPIWIINPRQLMSRRQRFEQFRTACS